MIEEKDLCYDIPDERDWDYEIFGEAKELPKKVKLLADEIQNQKLEGRNYGCVYYGGSSGANITNIYSSNTEYVKGKDLCKEAVDLGYLDPEKGSSLQNGRKILKDDKYIEGYYKVSGLETMKQVLSSNKIIYTGSSQIARKKIGEDNIVVKGSSYGHCFIIIGYDDDLGVFICQNSYGSEKYDKGYFYLKYEDISILFTCYTFEVKQENILSYKKKIMEGISLEGAKKAFELGFYNGKDNEKPITRQEAAVMAYRVYESVLKQLQK